MMTNLPERPPDSDSHDPQHAAAPGRASAHQPPEPITPEQTDAILQDAMQPYLDDGWQVLDRGTASVRLTRGMKNIDLQVDLLGHVATTESSLTPLQDSGRLVAWTLLIATLLVVLVLASVLGLI